MPPGGEDVARGFYRDLLGLSEEAKPTELAARGGCWFRSGAVRVHLGVEADFRPARKAHPALRVLGFARTRSLDFARDEREFGDSDLRSVALK